ncbi:MAG: Fe(3+) ABC transporter substrate-binding protein [Gloeomargarita sp. GMQP_bins_120]
MGISRREVLLGGVSLVTVTTIGRLTAYKPALAQRGVVNVYSSRHYDSDRELFRRFTQATGIQVNVLEGKDDELIERIRSEGRNSPADVLFTVDAGRLWRAQQAGLFRPVDSPLLTRSIPASLREPRNHWFGFTRRARVIMYNKDRVKPGDISTYEELADPKWRGQVLVRSSRNVYNQSLVGALIRHLGEARTERWARGLVENLARPPQGGDTDQIRAAAAGVGALAISNTYYLIRLLKSPNPADREVGQKMGIIFPNQNSFGTHVNISGAGVIVTAPHARNAVRFLEFLATREAQDVLARGNNEYPAVPGVPLDPVLASFGTFKQDPINASVFGRNNELALRITDRAGWA